MSSHFSSSLASGFLKNVMLYPNDNAIFVGGRYYTYRELLQIVLQIYEEIPKVKTHSTIGVYCSDDILSYASLLAINLYGAAYVPLNSKFPPSKNKKIIELAKLDFIISSSCIEQLSELADVSGILDLTNVNWKFLDQQGIKISQELLPKDFRKVEQPIAYILFTSGSTGEPKGVPVSHSNVHHFFNYFLKNYDFNEKDKFLQVYELTFDVSVFSFFMPLMVGACCYVLPTEGIKYLQTIDYLKRFEITILSMVPTTLRYLERYFKEIQLDQLRYSFFSGDALYYELALNWQQAIPKAVIHNFYGPTETTIVCTRYVFDVQQSLRESEYGIVPLGKPFEGMTALIVDENNLPCKKGELCFSGTQVIDQYLNGSNSEQFFTYQQRRFYKTGDIAAYNEFGNLVFYGRIDSQVKVNGYRIELAEIENAIRKILNANVIVLCKKNNSKSNELIVFIEELNFDKENLIESLSKELPSYMLPHVYLPIGKFELTENGKVDTRSLLNFM